MIEIFNSLRRICQIIVAGFELIKIFLILKNTFNELKEL